MDRKTKKNKSDTVNNNKMFRVITCNIPIDVIKILDDRLDNDAWSVSRSEVVRSAVEAYASAILRGIYDEDYRKLDKIADISKYRPDYGLLEEVKKNQQIFGNPTTEVNGKKYEFRYNNNQNPRWVCIGDVDEI